MSTGTNVPPMPTQASDVHVRGSRRKPVRTLKGDLAALKNKLAPAGPESAKDVPEPLGERPRDEKGRFADVPSRPVRSLVDRTREALDPGNSRTRPWAVSFLFSSVISWTVGPQIPTALYERIRFGTSTTDWGLLQGVGRWFRDTVGMAWETGQAGSLIWAAALGMLPMAILTLRNISKNHMTQNGHQGRSEQFAFKWLTRAAYLAPVVFFTGVSYPDQVTWLFGSPWTAQWWQFWVAGLFCSAYYCTLWVFDRMAKRLPLGFTHVMLMVPLSTIVTGILLYTPGAAW